MTGIRIPKQETVNRFLDTVRSTNSWPSPSSKSSPEPRVEIELGTLKPGAAQQNAQTYCLFLHESSGAGYRARTDKCLAQTLGKRETMLRAMLKISGVLIGVILLIFLCQALPTLIPPEVTLVGESRSGTHRFTMDHNFRVNGVMSLSLWQEGGSNYLWFVESPFSETNHLEYGVVRSRLQQRYPRNDRPEMLHSNTHYWIAVGFQYDTAFPPSACAGSVWYEFFLNNYEEIVNFVQSVPAQFPENYLEHRIDF
jgi:hypothetical protein